MTFSLVYVSRATAPFTRADLLGLLAQCRAKNAVAGVTGMLLYRDGKIIQLLEGDEDTVRSLFDHIGKDPRHDEVVNLWSGTSEDRQFPDWSMGFHDLTGEAITEDGWTDVLSRDISAYELTHTPNLGHELLQLFRKFS